MINIEDAARLIMSAPRPGEVFMQPIVETFKTRHQDEITIMTFGDPTLQDSLTIFTGHENTPDLINPVGKKYVTRGFHARIIFYPPEVLSSDIERTRDDFLDITEGVITRVINDHQIESGIMPNKKEHLMGISLGSIYAAALAKDERLKGIVERLILDTTPGDFAAAAANFSDDFWGGDVVRDQSFRQMLEEEWGIMNPNRNMEGLEGIEILFLLTGPDTVFPVKEALEFEHQLQGKGIATAHDIINLNHKGGAFVNFRRTKRNGLFLREGVEGLAHRQPTLVDKVLGYPEPQLPEQQ